MRLLPLFLCICVPGVVSGTYTHACYIPDRARSVFSFDTETDCTHQRHTVQAVVTPELHFDENTDKTECVYKGGKWVQTNVWAQYPRGLHLDDWQLDERVSPITLTFRSRKRDLACGDGVQCVQTDPICRTTASVVCGSFVIGLWWISAFWALVYPQS